MKKKTALVIFRNDLPQKDKTWWREFDAIIAPPGLRRHINEMGFPYVPLDQHIETESIYEASAFAEELSRLKHPNGTRLVKTFIYEGYELWWGHYMDIFTRFCLPYTKYKKLLDLLKGFERVHFLNAPSERIFPCFFSAYEIDFTSDARLNKARLPFGIIVQILLTFLFVLILILRRPSILVSTGDKFEPSRDFDFRMRFIYEELRKKNLPFLEFVRSLEPSKIILKHAWTRRRPVLYTEAVTFIGRFISFITDGRRSAKRIYGPQTFSSVTDKELRFKLIVATQYISTVYDDVASIRLLKWLLPMFGIRAAIITATTERNFHTVLACKLNNIPIVGILHGAASRYYNVYEFLPAFEGEKRITADKYGVWSQWWKDYFTTFSKAYEPEQLFVSGPMRPILKRNREITSVPMSNRVKVLFVSEVVAIPTEVMPYLDALMIVNDFEVYIKFRATHDSFEKWLSEHRPDVLKAIGPQRILKSSMYEALEQCDIAVGSQSTGVIEAVLLNKPFILFNTRKWGDYFDMKSFSNEYNFFAEDPLMLISYIRSGINIPVNVLKTLQEKFFGNPYQNGSKWVVEKIEEYTKSNI
jgi:hypothetical protein